MKCIDHLHFLHILDSCQIILGMSQYTVFDRQMVSGGDKHPKQPFLSSFSSTANPLPSLRCSSDSSSVGLLSSSSSLSLLSSPVSWDIKKKREIQYLKADVRGGVEKRGKWRQRKWAANTMSCWWSQEPKAKRTKQPPESRFGT